MLRGPIEYVPPAAVEVMLKRQAIPLDENEGIYVRDIKTGKVGVQLWFKRSDSLNSPWIAMRAEETPRCLLLMLKANAV